MSGSKNTLLGGLILIFEAIGKKLVGLISTLILARVLVPEDFGLVAICTLTMGFIQIFYNVGSQEYLMRSKEINDDTVNTSWTINVILKLLVAILLASSSGIVASYFDDPRVVPILLVYSFSLAICSFSNPGLNLLRRQHKYAPIVKLTITAKIISVFVAVTIALIYESYWALVIGQVTSDVVRWVGGYYIHGFRPKFCLKNAKEQWQFSGWVIPQGILGYSRTQLDTFLVSSTFGATVLGSYHVMKYLAFIPSSQILLPATQPLLVELTKVKDDFSEFAFQFNVTALVTFVIALSMGGFLYIEQGVVIRILLGENWTEYAVLFGYFSLLIPAYAMLHHARRAMLVFAKTKAIFIYEVLSFGAMYSWLLYVGLDDLMVFTHYRVLLENVFSLMLLVYATSRFISLQNCFKLLVLTVPILLSLFCAMMASQAIITEINVLALGLLKAVSYLLVFVAVMLLSYVLAFHRFKEWQYLFGLMKKATTKITKNAL